MFPELSKVYDKIDKYSRYYVLYNKNFMKIVVFFYNFYFYIVTAVLDH